MGEINAMCTKSTMLELIFRGDPSGTSTHLYSYLPGSHSGSL